MTVSITCIRIFAITSLKLLKLFYTGHRESLFLGRQVETDCTWSKHSLSCKWWNTHATPLFRLDKQAIWLTFHRETPCADSWYCGIGAIKNLAVVFSCLIFTINSRAGWGKETAEEMDGSNSKKGWADRFKRVTGSTNDRQQRPETAGLPYWKK